MKNILTISILLFIAACASAQPGKAAFKIRTVEEKKILSTVDSLIPGTRAFEATSVNYLRQGKKVLNIRFSEPIVVSVATKPEKWGYFQFPKIGRMPDQSIHIRWRLNDDAMEAYGSHSAGEAISRDGGKTYKIATGEQPPFTDLLLTNGERITINTPKPIPASELQLPEAIGGSMDTYSKSTTRYYRLQDLPEKVKLLYFDRLPKGGSKWVTEASSLTDPRAARHLLRGFMPILWWGDMRFAKDKSIVAGIYPGFYVKDDGKADSLHHVFFYRSTDNGHSWNIQGRIFYEPNLSVDPKGKQRMGFTEPGYDVLTDGTMFCVLRTTDGIGNGPMYGSRSNDNGVTWTKPDVITPSGVLPQVLQLKNGVLVMVSGRPGVQIRFSTDGKGEVWSNPFEMLPWIDYKDQVSCGYTSLLATGPDRFMIVYSDFRYVNENGEVRKAIKVREVIVQPQK